MKPKTKILIADDESAIRESMGLILKDEGYDVTLASHGKEALDFLSQSDFDVVFCDLRMPQVNGFEVLKQTITHKPSTIFIIITAFGDMDSAIESLKLGAFDYIPKPLLFDDIVVKLNHLLKFQNLVTENEVLKTEAAEKYIFDQIIGQGPTMRQVYSLMRKVSTTNDTLLISGERGTGKKIVAKAIHYNSPRKSKKFNFISCGRDNEALLDKKIYGYQSPTDSYEGLLQKTHRGTLFLDEIEKLTKPLQEKLLHFLENPTSDVRIIAATNRDLVDAVNCGDFHEKLFDKINSFEIRIPPLRARRQDIPFLIKYFIRKYNYDFGKHIVFVEDTALRGLIQYDWPGNIRELANILERAVILTTHHQYLTSEDLPGDIVKYQAQPNNVSNIKEAVKLYEVKHIRSILEKNNFDKKTAAEALGLSLSSLYRKLDELSIH